MRFSLIIFIFFSCSHSFGQTKRDTIDVFNLLFNELKIKSETKYPLNNIKAKNKYYIATTSFKYFKELYYEINQIGLIRNGIDTVKFKEEFLNAQRIRVDQYLKKKTDLFFDGTNREIDSLMSLNAALESKKVRLIFLSLSTPIFINNICLIFESTYSYTITHLFEKINNIWKVRKKIYPIYDTVY